MRQPARPRARPTGPAAECVPSWPRRRSELLADRIDFLARLGDVGIQVTPVIGEDPARSRIEDNQRLEMCGLFEGVGDLVEQRMNDRLGLQGLAVFALDRSRQMKDDVCDS